MTYSLQQCLEDPFVVCLPLCIYVLLVFFRLVTISSTNTTIVIAKEKQGWHHAQLSPVLSKVVPTGLDDSPKFVGQTFRQDCHDIMHPETALQMVPVQRRALH